MMWYEQEEGGEIDNFDVRKDCALELLEHGFEIAAGDILLLEAQSVDPLRHALTVAKESGQMRSVGNALEYAALSGNYNSVARSFSGVTSDLLEDIVDLVHATPMRDQCWGLIDPVLVIYSGIPGTKTVVKKIKEVITSTKRLGYTGLRYGSIFYQMAHPFGHELVEAYQGHDQLENIVEIVMDSCIKTMSGPAAVFPFLRKNKEHPKIEAVIRECKRQINGSGAFEMCRIRMSLTPHLERFGEHIHDLINFGAVYQDYPKSIRDELTYQEAMLLQKTRKACQRQLTNGMDPLRITLARKLAYHTFIEFFEKKMEEGKTVKKKKEILREWCVNILEAFRKNPGLQLVEVFA